MSTASWTEVRVEHLKRLWREGLSAAEIASRLTDVTRNAVLGKLHRLGLLGGRAGRAASAERPRLSRVPHRGTQGRRRLPPPAPAVPPPLEGQVERLEALGPHACCWPIGDPRSPGFRFCGRPGETAPYCPVHRGLAYRPAEPRARSPGGGR